MYAKCKWWKQINRFVAFKITQGQAAISASAEGHPPLSEVRSFQTAAGAVGVRTLPPSHDSLWTNIFKRSFNA